MAGSIIAKMSNSTRSGNAGKMFGSMSACKRVASASSVPMRSFSAVMVVRCSSYSARSFSISAKTRLRFSISSPVRILSLVK